MTPDPMNRTVTPRHALLILVLVLTQWGLAAHDGAHLAPDSVNCLMCLGHLPSIAATLPPDLIPVADFDAVGPCPAATRSRAMPRPYQTFCSRAPPESSVLS